MLDFYGQMPFGDVQSMLAFWGDHAMAHASIAGRLGSKLTDTIDIGVPLGSDELVTSSSVFDVADQAALGEWIQGMTDKDKAPSRPDALQRWLEAHYALHAAELQALNSSSSYDLSVLDVRDPMQFMDWMDAHARLHAAENDALGI